MAPSSTGNSFASIALRTLVPLLILAVSGLAQAKGPGGMDLNVTCQFVENAQAVDPQGFSGPGLHVAGSISGLGDGTAASLGEQVCGGITIALEEQGKGPWTTLFQGSADMLENGTFSQLVPLCNVVTQNADAKVVRATAAVLVSITNCTDGSTTTLSSRCTDSSTVGNRPAVSLPSASELDAMCADANI
ncbi:MAG: hypothetical protein R3268_06685 [Acidiferrobacterales bacterium]|nr:hypothetical protein [Acidiferrobacterales bacterium]